MRPRPRPYSPSRAASISAFATPSTRTTFSRDFSPRTTLTREGATPTRFAISLQRALLALPSTGGAVTFACKTPSRIPLNSSLLPRARSRTLICAAATGGAPPSEACRVGQQVDLLGIAGAGAGDHSRAAGARNGTGWPDAEVHQP